MEKQDFTIDVNREKMDLEKYTSLFYLMDFWMKAMEDGKKVSSFFTERKWHKVAIYGMGAAGKHLYRQLQDSPVQVLYTMDRKKVCYQNQEYELDKAFEMLPAPEVLVVTPIMEYQSIKDKMKEKTSCRILSLEEVILSL